MAHAALTPRQASNLVDRVEAWFAELRQAVQDAREQAQLRRQLRGVDDHLLRDMGLKWTGRHFERIAEEDWR